MNAKKIALFAGMISFVGINALETWFDVGVFMGDKKPSTSTFVFNVLMYTSTKESFSNKLRKKGTFRRFVSSNIRYSESNTNLFDGKSIARPIAYIAADQLVAPIVFNSSNVQNSVKKFSPEMQQEIKDTVTVIGASGLAKSAEALYDYHYENKPLEKSAKEFALNAGSHVANKVVYHSLVKPAIEEAITPGLEPVAEFAAGYAAAYIVTQMIKKMQ